MTDDGNAFGQHIPAPSGCRWCGLEARGHAQRWKPPVGWHKWEPPTPEQRKERMLARRRQAGGTGPARPRRSAFTLRPAF